MDIWQRENWRREKDETGKETEALIRYAEKRTCGYWKDTNSISVQVR